MSKTFAQKSEFPLRWPAHIPRTKKPESSRFSTTLFQALGNVEKSLQMMAKDSGKQVTDIKLSSNVTLVQNPDDGGVAVYFRWNDADFCIPVDRYNKPAENLQAIHHIIEADRTKIRHGGIAFVMAEKRGQTLLLEDGSDKHWSEVLGIEKTASIDEIANRRRELVKIHHPDRGGNPETFNKIQAAYKQAAKEV